MSDDTSKKPDVLPAFYECDECGRLFQATSWTDSRVLVASSGDDSTCYGDAVYDFVERKEWRVVCGKCRGART